MRVYSSRRLSFQAVTLRSRREHGAVVARHERLEGLLVAGAQPRDELALIGGRLRALDAELRHPLSNLPAACAAVQSGSQRPRL